MRIPPKGKNKGKYISFHYLRGWKARKIRKVQEISPQIPIFDEATANIDEKRRGRFYQLLHALSREKIIIFSTHNLEELREADIIVDLEKLHIRQVSEK